MPARAGWIERVRTMSTLALISTTLKVNDTETTIVSCTVSSSQTSFTMPYKLVERLATDDEFVATLASNIIDGKGINLDSLMSKDNSIAITQQYLTARASDMPDLVRVANDGTLYARRTSPAAFVRRFIVPAIESALTAHVLACAGIDGKGCTPEHLATIARTVATTSVESKLTHYTRGTSNADKAAHNVRAHKLSRRERAALRKGESK